MDVLVISHLYPRASNRVLGIFVHEQVKALVRQGHRVRVLSGEPFWINTFDPRRVARALRVYRASSPSWSRFDGVQVCYFPYVTGSASPFDLQSHTYALGARRAAASLALEPPQLVHAHTAYLDGSAARSLLRTHGWKYLLTEHTGPFSSLTSNWHRRRRTRAAVLGASRVLAVSPALATDMSAELSLKANFDIQVIPNGVDTAAFHPSEISGPSERMRVLWVGHHVGVKRVDVLLRAFAEAHRSDARLQLTLVGDGALKHAAERLARSLGVSDACHFLPAMNRNAVADTMRAHDFLVLSSETETFGIVAAEAMSCGLPVLSTRCGGPESFVEQPTAGMLVDKPAPALAEGLRAMAVRVSAGCFDKRQISELAAVLFSRDLVARQLSTHYAAALA